MTDFNEEELEMLTPQERETLESEQELQEVDVPEVVQADADNVPLEAAVADNADDKSRQEDPDPQEENEVELQNATPPTPVFPTFNAPQDAAVRLEEVDKTLASLGSTFEEGGLTAVEYQRQMLQLMNEKIELKEQIFKASLSQEVHEKTWFEVTVPAFLDAHPQYRENEILFDSLNSQVKRLQGENPDKPFSPDILAQAHSKLASVFNFGVVRQEQAVNPARIAPQPQRDMPPNLGSLPASDMTEAADGGLFRHLDQLADENVEKYEEELAKLPEEQLEAYLKFA